VHGEKFAPLPSIITCFFWVVPVVTAVWEIKYLLLPSNNNAPDLFSGRTDIASWMYRPGFVVVSVSSCRRTWLICPGARKLQFPVFNELIVLCCPPISFDAVGTVAWR
jgi:hypothetical protein